MKIQGVGQKGKIKYVGTSAMIDIERVGDSWATWVTNYIIDSLYVEGNHNEADFIINNEVHKGLISRCYVYWFKNAINLKYGYMIDI